MDKYMDVVDFAWQVIDMQRKIDEQDRELTRLTKYEKMYHDLLDSRIGSGNAARPAAWWSCA